MRLAAILDALAARLVADLERETAAITSAIATRQLGDGSDYWKRRHRLERKLAVVAAMRDALSEGGR